MSDQRCRRLVRPTTTRAVRWDLADVDRRRDLPEAHTLALAGGAAMVAYRFVPRLTHDVDLFTEVDDREAVLVTAALRTALEQRSAAGSLRP